MALLHKATLRPTKLELLTGWLPDRPWHDGQRAVELEHVAGFRFDDPAGAVGIETMLVRAGDGPIYQVPLTYRDAPLDGGDGWLIGTTDHSALGQRWMYDACGDPVYVAALAAAIFAGADQAELLLDVNGRLERREPTMAISSSGGQDADRASVGAVRRVVDGDPTLIVTDSVELAVLRRLDGRPKPTAAALTGPALSGTWNGQPDPMPLAYAAPLSATPNGL